MEAKFHPDQKESAISYILTDLSVVEARNTRIVINPAQCLVVTSVHTHLFVFFADMHVYFAVRCVGMFLNGLIRASCNRQLPSDCSGLVGVLAEP